MDIKSKVFSILGKCVEVDNFFNNVYLPDLAKTNLVNLNKPTEIGLLKKWVSHKLPDIDIDTKLSWNHRNQITILVTKKVVLVVDRLQIKPNWMELDPKLLVYKNV